MVNRSRVLWMAILLTLAAVFTAACTSSTSPTPTPPHVAVGDLGPTKAPPPTATPPTGGPSGMAAMPQLPDVISVVERVGPSVVSVLVQLESRDFSSGSGVIFDAQSHILTNNHVIQGAKRVSVTLEDGQQYDARIVGSDPLTDLAVLKIEGVNYPNVSFTNPASVRVGQWVIAIGNALSLPGGPTVTVGIVSARDRSFEVQQGQVLYNLIQTDTVINPGNSGGPLLNLAGEIIGINTAVLRGGRIEGIGFAVSAETAISVSQELIENGRVRWAWLGGMFSELSPEEAAKRNLSSGRGVLVTDVVEDGPAWQAGIRPGDVALSIVEREVPTVRDLVLLLRDFREGDTVAVGIWRDNQRQTLHVTLGARPVR